MYEVTHPDTGKAVRTPANGWRYSREKMDELIAHGRVLFGPDEKTSPRIKRFLAEQGDRVPYPTFTQSRMPGTKKLDNLLRNDLFDYPKDFTLLARWFGAITRDNPKAVILDFFAGSGSTGHAVMQLNAADGGERRFVLVQIDEGVDHNDYATIADLARERLRRAGVQVRQEAGPSGASIDVGFRSLHVAATNMADTLTTADDLRQFELSAAVQSVKPHRTEEDLLFQVILDWGLDLAEPIAVKEFAGRRVMIVADGALIACFADQVTDLVVHEIAKRRPIRAVFLDAGFVTDADRINAEQIFRELSPETDVRTI